MPWQFPKSYMTNTPAMLRCRISKAPDFNTHAPMTKACAADACSVVRGASSTIGHRCRILDRPRYTQLALRVFLSIVLLMVVAGCRSISPDPSSSSVPAIETWRGVHVPVRDDQQLAALELELPQLAAAGANVVVVEVNYNFDFK